MRVVLAAVEPFREGHKFEYQGKVDYMTSRIPDREVPSVEQVEKAIREIMFPLDHLDMPVFIVPYQLRLWSEKYGWGQAYHGRTYPTHVIIGNLPKNSLDAWLTHEIGHAVQYSLPEERYKEYLQLRGIENWLETGLYEQRPREIFAEDFRVLFGNEQARQAEYFPQIDLPGDEVREWFLSKGVFH